MAEPDANFLALPEPHHHVSRLLILSVVLAVVAALVWAYTVFFAPSEGLLPGRGASSGRTLTDAERIRMMNQAAPVPLQNPKRTDEQRLEMMSRPSSAKVQNPTLTDAERLKIMNGN